ncbi:MAG: hypothetical protein JSW40_01980 [Candidatus Omnitrophota bacterium]|nr:MAG: hypothetical protein JSW40_01980 [Candidatus Omnitrophota bacterium]
MTNDNFFRLAFLCTLLVMGIIFSTNIERTTVQRSHKDEGETVIFEEVDVEKIKKLIDEQSVSGREALYYNPINNHP